MAGKPSRTPSQEKYRKEMGSYLLGLREYGAVGREIAKTFLEMEKHTPEYEQSATKTIREKERYREDWNKYVMDYIDGNDYNDREIKEYIESSSALDFHVAKRLIEKGQGKLVHLYPMHFKPSDEIIEIFLSFDIRDHMDRKDTQWIVNYLFGLPDDITGLTKKSVEKLFKSDVNTTAIVRNLHKFGGLDKETFFMFLNRGLRIEQFEEFIRRLEYFSGLDKEAFLAIVSKINDRFDYDEEGLWKILSISFDSFEGLDEEIAIMLTEKGYGRYVAKHPEKFGLKKEK